MAIVCAFLLSFLGAVLIYLSHARQRLLRLSLPVGVRVAGTMAILASCWMWCEASGVAAGLAGALTSLMLAGVVMPYIAWWRGTHTVAARAEKP